MLTVFDKLQVYYGSISLYKFHLLHLI